jgi:hypothetical protein
MPAGPRPAALAAGTVLATAAAALLVVFGHEPGRTLTEAAFPEARTAWPAKNAKLKTVRTPSSVPFVLESFLNDFEVTPEAPADLFRHFPEGIHSIPDIASGSARQFAARGSPGQACLTLRASWRLPMPLAFVITDRIGRPVAHGDAASGSLSIPVWDSLYRVRIHYEGTIPEDATFELTGAPLPACPAEVLGYEHPVPDIATLDLAFSGTGRAQFELLWRHHAARIRGEKHESGEPIQTRPERIKSYLRFNGDREHSVAELWAAGAGDIRHFDTQRPSFTGRILSGRLVHGMSRFKLYGLPTKEGFLDYVVGALAAKEGILVPRWKMIRLRIDGRDAGLYIMEELPSTEFFEALHAYESPMSSLGRVYHEVKQAQPAADVSDRPDLVAESVEPRAFAKMIAFLSRYHATHGLENTELRFLQDPASGVVTPVLRDLNVNAWAENGLGIRSLLVHTSWWMGERFHGMGSQTRVKSLTDSGPEQDCSNCSTWSDAYTYDSTTLGLAGTHPAIQVFVRNAANRVLVDRNLLYYTSAAYRTATLEHFRRLYRSALPYLNVESPKFTEWLAAQAENVFAPGDTAVGRLVQPLMRKSRLLVIEYQRSADEVGYALYNLSPFSMSLVPGNPFMRYAVRTDTFDQSAEFPVIAPSKLFPILVNGLYAQEEEVTTGRLNRRLIRTALHAEFRSYLKTYQAVPFYPGTPPFLRFMLPLSEEKHFVDHVRRNAVVSIAGVTTLAPSRTILDADLPEDGFANYQAIINREGEDLPLQPIPPAVSFLQAGQYPIQGGYVFRYLVSNRLDQTLRIALERVASSAAIPVVTGDTASAPERYATVARVQFAAISDSGIDLDAAQGGLPPAAGSPISSDSGLWLDSMLGLLNGPQRAGAPSLGIVDIYLRVDATQSYVVSGREPIGYGLLGSRPRLVEALVNLLALNGTPVRVHEPAMIPLWPHELLGGGDPGARPFSTLRAPGNRRTAGTGEYIESIHVASGETLVIPPGSRLRFGPNAGLLVFGTLEARGTAERPITLEPLADSWKGILAVGSDRPARRHVLEHVTVRGAAGGEFAGRRQMGGVTFVQSHVTLRHVRIVDTPAEDGLGLYRSWFEISDSEFSGTRVDAVDADWSNGRISRSRFSRCGGDCMDFSGSSVELRDIVVEGAGDKCFSIGEGSVARLERTQARDCRIGLAAKDASIVVGADNLFEAPRLAAIATYVKKPGYGEPVVALARTKTKGPRAVTLAEDPRRPTSRFD